MEQQFLFEVEEFVYIAGRGTVAVGRLVSGVVRVGDELELVSDQEVHKVTVMGIEAFRNPLQGLKTENMGLVLKNCDPNLAGKFILRKAGDTIG